MACATVVPADRSTLLTARQTLRCAIRRPSISHMRTCLCRPLFQLHECLAVDSNQRLTCAIIRSSARIVAYSAQPQGHGRLDAARVGSHDPVIGTSPVHSVLGALPVVTRSSPVFSLDLGHHVRDSSRISAHIDPVDIVASSSNRSISPRHYSTTIAESRLVHQGSSALERARVVPECSLPTRQHAESRQSSRSRRCGLEHPRGGPWRSMGRAGPPHPRAHQGPYA